MAGHLHLWLGTCIYGWLSVAGHLRLWLAFCGWTPASATSSLRLLPPAYVCYLQPTSATSSLRLLPPAYVCYLQPTSATSSLLLLSPACVCRHQPPACSLQSAIGNDLWLNTNVYGWLSVAEHQRLWLAFCGTTPVAQGLSVRAAVPLNGG